MGALSRQAAHAATMLVAAGTVLAVATPASAQWAPRPAYGYNQNADLSFRCDVDNRGYVRDVDINRRY